jgi:RimJ/RimL family protein N-acetyltransferase
MGMSSQQLVYELPWPQVSIAAPIFKDAWADEAYIDSFFEGKQEGRIFVDDAHNPTAALLARTFEYYVAGDTGASSLRQFIKEAPSEPGIFQHLYGYVPIGQEWERALLEDYAGTLHVIERRGFKYNSDRTPFDWRQSLPEGASVVPIDRPLAERIDGEMRQFIASFWGGYDNYAQGGFGFCTLVNGEIASIAYAITVSSRQANIDVETAEPFRKRGLAAITCAAFIEHCLTLGLQPTWDTDAINAGSLALARKLGFTEYEPFSQLSPPWGQKIALSTGLWSREEAGPSPFIIWRRIA